MTLRPLGGLVRKGVSAMLRRIAIALAAASLFGAASTPTGALASGHGAHFGGGGFSHGGFGGGGFAGGFGGGGARNFAGPAGRRASLLCRARLCRSGRCATLSGSPLCPSPLCPLRRAIRVWPRPRIRRL